jgi:hypothetical protein
MSEWLKETGCKPVGSAYAGSNPAPPIIITIAPEWNRAFRYGAVLVIIICTVIALRPLMSGTAVGHARPGTPATTHHLINGTSVGHPRPVTPATTHHLLRAACASALKGHFAFISDGTSSMNIPATCNPRREVLQSI